MTERPLYYDREGQPTSVEVWQRLHADYHYKVVQKDQRGDVEVSTVWIGLDHSFGAEGGPVIFETMIFGGDRDGEMWRWRTELEALAGHAEIASGVLR